MGRRTTTLWLMACAGSAAIMAVQAAQASALGATNAERRVRELEQELRILKSRMKAVAVRRAGANTRTLSVRRVRKRVQVIVDAQVHRAVLFGLSRRDTEIIHTDGDQSSTRIRIRGRAHAPGGWRVEARIEFELESNPSNRTDDTNIDEVRPPSLRKARIRFRHRRWGTIALGRESTATSGITSLDLSATRVAIYSNVETAGGGFRHTNSMLDPPVGGTTVGSVWDNFDGASRAELLRYDSPKWYGFWLSASWAQGDVVHGAIRFVGAPFGSRHLKLAAGFGWVYTPGIGSTAPGNPAGGVSHEYAGSVSLLHIPSGLSLTYAMGAKALAASGPTSNVPNPWSAYFKIGWQTKAALPRVGRTALAGDVFYARDALPGALFRGIGLAVVQHVALVAADLYIVYRIYDLRLKRLPSRGQSTLHVIMMGSRVKF